jgi:hypothetical protein
VGSGEPRPGEVLAHAYNGSGWIPLRTLTQTAKVRVF